MESPPDPASDPGNGVSEPVTPVRETPVNLETLRKAEHQAPVRRQSCSSTNRGKRQWLFWIDTVRILRNIDAQNFKVNSLRNELGWRAVRKTGFGRRLFIGNRAINENTTHLWDISYLDFRVTVVAPHRRGWRSNHCCWICDSTDTEDKKIIRFYWTFAYVQRESLLLLGIVVCNNTIYMKSAVILLMARSFLQSNLGELFNWDCDNIPETRSLFNKYMLVLRYFKLIVLYISFIVSMHCTNFYLELRYKMAYRKHFTGIYLRVLSALL